MNRRMFLTGTGAGLVHPVGLLALGPAVIRQGDRRLKDITVDELMELLAWAEIKLEDLTTLEEEQRERRKPIASLHPHYYLEYMEGEPKAGRPECIWFRYWWCDPADDEPEWTQVDGYIEVGDVRIHDGYTIASASESVKWFLDHGFKVW